MNIYGKRIVLRGIESADVPHLHAWSNDPALVAGQGEVHFPSSLWQQNRWFERIQSDERNLRLAVQHVDGDLIGYTGLWGLNWQDRRAEHGLVVGNPHYARQGYGREIVLTCARYAFEELGMHRLDATIIASNGSSLKLYEGCGFKQEGLLREHTFRKGAWVDRILVGLLASDYFASDAVKAYWNE